MDNGSEPILSYLRGRVSALIAWMRCILTDAPPAVPPRTRVSLRVIDGERQDSPPASPVARVPLEAFLPARKERETEILDETIFDTTETMLPPAHVVCQDDIEDLQPMLPRRGLRLEVTDGVRLNLGKNARRTGRKRDR